MEMGLGQKYTIGIENITVQTNSSTPYDLLMIAPASNVPVYLEHLIATASVTAASIQRLQLVFRSSASTGGTAVTPAKLDTADAASGATAMTLPTGKGTEAANPISTQTAVATQAVTATYPGTPGLLLARWDFDRLRSKPLIIDVGTTKGICVKNITAIAGGTVYVNALIDETSF